MKLDRAIREIHSLEDLAERDTALCRIHPLAKVLVTLWYLALVMSFDKRDITGLCGMSLYPLTAMILGDISVGQALRRLRPVLLTVAFVGAANPFFDRTPCFTVGGFAVTGGMLSMVTLFLKAGFAAAASYLLIATTTVEEICYALRKLHVPPMPVTVMLLIYRYLVLMLKEAGRLTQAYSLRAPGERGIRGSAWGPFAGQMLLRSMDRAQAVYESMTLRGFHGEFHPRRRAADCSTGSGCGMARGIEWRSVFYVLTWGAVMAALRFVPVFRMVGENII